MLADIGRFALHEVVVAMANPGSPWPHTTGFRGGQKCRSTGNQNEPYVSYVGKKTCWLCLQYNLYKLEDFQDPALVFVFISDHF